MKKQNFRHLMAMGLASGLLMSNHLVAADNASKPKSDFMKKVEESKGNITEQELTEDELLLELNEEGARLYKSLSPEGKKLALKEAGRACNGNNDCAGLNACATKDNNCAGQGSCRGKTKCGFSDKNLAVKVVAKKMAEKRKQAQQSR